MSRKDTREAFIEKAINRHGDKYTYSLVNYTNACTPVVITCKLHGNFNQTPSSHSSGRGCPTCAGNTKYDTPEFIRKANIVHRNKYIYTGTNYVNNNEKVLITCSTHGDFKQTPNDHLRGRGCYHCGMLKVSTALIKPVSDFILDSTKIHGYKYDYDGVVYLGIDIKVLIRCKVHGYFEQTPYSHLHGSGCPTCAESGFNKAKPAILYYLSINNGEAYKIGITNRTVKERFNNIDLVKIKILQETKYINGADAYDAEQKILNDFREFKYTGPNLLSSGNTELFSKDVLNIGKGD